jgi:L-fuconate dehydratase
LNLLKANEGGKSKRASEIAKQGVPAYITSVGWMGYDDEKIKRVRVFK